MTIRNNHLRLAGFLVIAALAACGRPADLDLTQTASADATQPTPVIPTPEIPPETLVVCLAEEPSTLYIYDPSFYGAGAHSAESILQAVYDGPVDLVDYSYQSVILDGLPDLTTGQDAVIEEVAVLEGGIYLNPETRLPENLAVGSSYLPVGCRSQSCAETYQGGEVIMEQMVADFHLQPGLSWSDGQPLTAADSVFSYQINADPATRTAKYLVDRTSSYEVVDDTTVRWYGIPGWFDAEYQSLFWSPLPQHQLGEYTVEELQTLDTLTRSPLGWGPFVIQEWQAGEQIVLARNEHYLSAAGEPPFFDVLIFRFIGLEYTDALQQLVTGECDVVDETYFGIESLPMMNEMQQSGQVEVTAAPGSSLTRLDFNLEPLGGNRIFADQRTRQALAMCVDRQALVDAIFPQYGLVTDSFVSPASPLYHQTDDGLIYDPEAASQMLQDMGWIFTQDPPDGPRQSFGVSWLLGGTPLSFELLVPAGTVEEQVAGIIQNDLAACGAEVTINSVDAVELSIGWPDGLVFGRKFQAVVWTWPDWVVPLCQMYASSEIPSDEALFGSNAGAFRDPAYDAACERILFDRPDSESFVEAITEVQTIFQEQRPAIPLFVQPRYMAYRPGLCGLSLDSLSFTAYWNMENWFRAESCEINN